MSTYDSARMILPVVRFNRPVNIDASSSLIGALRGALWQAEDDRIERENRAELVASHKRQRPTISRKPLIEAGVAGADLEPSYACRSMQEPDAGQLMWFPRPET